MIDRDTAEPLIRGLWLKISSGKLPEAKRQPLSNIKGLLEALQDPEDDAHERRILDGLVRQVRQYESARTAVAQTEGSGK